MAWEGGVKEAEVQGSFHISQHGEVESALGPIPTSEVLGIRMVHEVKMRAGKRTKRLGSSNEGGLRVLQALH